MRLRVRTKNRYVWRVMLLVACGFLVQPAIAANKADIANTPQCQQVENVETLIAQLLPSLPSYTNRVSQRYRRHQNSNSYVLIAGRAEFAPLTLGPGAYLPQEQPQSQQPQQVFITTLERHYIDGKPVELQQFHWLFLTRSNDVWRLAIMFSRTGNPTQQPPTRPRDSSNGVIAQAIRLWLRDCQTNL